MIKVTKNVILDLLPLYIGGEVSEDTETLVREYLDSDPELAEVARQMAQADSHNEVPAPRSKEAEMEGFEKTKQLLIMRSTFVIGLIAMFLCTIMLVVPVMLVVFDMK